MRRTGLERSNSPAISQALEATQAAIRRIHADLDRTWAEQISDNRHDAPLQLQSRLRRLESAYLDTQLALRHAYDDESRVLLFVLGAKLMHDIAEYSERYDLPITIASPVPESDDLRDASVAWLKRGIVIASVQDRHSHPTQTLRGMEPRDIDWRSPAGSREDQLAEAEQLLAAYIQKSPQPLTPAESPTQPTAYEQAA